MVVFVLLHLRQREEFVDLASEKLLVCARRDVSDRCCSDACSQAYQVVKSHSSHFDGLSYLGNDKQLVYDPLLNCSHERLPLMVCDRLRSPRVLDHCTQDFVERQPATA